MSPSCIHGFSAEQCASCRPCPHGLTAGGCGRCAATNATLAKRRLPTSTGDHPAEEHAGFEIFYDPSVSGWQYRAPDATPSPVSYRSAFLARKAVDQLADGAGNGAKAGRATRRRS